MGCMIAPPRIYIGDARSIHTTEVAGAGRLFFNLYTLRLPELTKRGGAMADSLLREPDPPRATAKRKKLRKLLIDNGFLIPERASEFATLRRSRMVSRAAGGSLNITVILSLGCNFRCTCCCEHHSMRRMSEKIRSALGWLVRRNAPRDGLAGLTAPTVRFTTPASYRRRTPLPIPHESTHVRGSTCQRRHRREDGSTSRGGCFSA